MLDVAAVARGAGFAISAVTCRDDHTSWSVPQMHDGYDVVLVRHGQFRRSVDGRCADIDQTVGYLGLPGGEERFAHPRGGDVCTWIRLEAPLWRSLIGQSPPPAEPIFYVDARLDLSHRRMLAAAREPHAAEEVTHHLHGLLASLLGQWADRGMPVHQSSGAADRAMVAAAREAILAGHPESHALTPLAAALGVSPFRLSRAFGREMGVSITRYRNRVRLTRALDRLAKGEADLAGLAAELGFADQAHLCRTVRQHLGHTPTALGRLLVGSATSTSRGNAQHSGSRPRP